MDYVYDLALGSSASDGVWELQTYSGALDGAVAVQASASGRLANSNPVVYALPTFDATQGVPQSWDLRPYWYDADGDACIVGFYPALPAGWSVTQNPSTLHYDGVGAVIDLAGFSMWADDGKGLAGVPWSFATAAGQLSSPIPLAGIAGGETAVAGALTTQIRLSGAAVVESLVQGGLLAQVLFAAAAQVQAQAAGNLGTGIQLGGAAQDVASAAGNLSTGIRLGGAAAGQVSAQGAIGGGAALSGQAQAVATVLGELGTAIRMAGAALTAASVQGGLVTQILLAAQAQAQAQASGALASGQLLGGNASSVTTAVASLLTAISLAGQAQSQAAGGGTLDTGARLAGSAGVAASAVGQLLTGILLSGQVDAAASASAAWQPQAQLAAAPQAQATATARLGADASIPELIIARLEAALRDRTDAGPRVWRSREAALQRDETPAIVIQEPEDESVRVFSEEDDYTELVVPLRVAVRGARYGRTADPVLVQLHGIVMADPVLRTYRVFDRRRMSADWEAEDAGQVQGVVLVRYRFRYMQRRDHLIAAPV
jgi:hypothetical protein